MTLTKQQRANIQNKRTPLPHKRYLITDQCFWKENPPEDYNPLDPERKPHGITLVDVDSGTIVFLESGSIIQIVEPRKRKT